MNYVLIINIGGWVVVIVGIFVSVRFLQRWFTRKLEDALAEAYEMVLSRERHADSTTVSAAPGLQQWIPHESRHATTVEMPEWSQAEDGDEADFGTVAFQLPSTTVVHEPSDREGPLDRLPDAAVDIAPDGIPRPAWLRAIRGLNLDLLVSDEEVTIGRAPDRTVVVDDPEVSRNHLRLIQERGRWYVEDDGGSNGTFVNDERVPPLARIRLHSGDVIGAGHNVAFVLRTRSAMTENVVLSVGGATATGSRRRNEDAYCIAGDVVAVADGAGGRPGGDVASGIAVDFIRSAKQHVDWQSVVEEISSVILSRGEQQPEIANMATTLDAARLINHGDFFSVSGVHIGDGLAVLDDGVQLVELTSPHTVGAALARKGDPSARRHPERGRLLRAIGLNDSRVDVWERRAAVGQRYILSTDGAVRSIGPERLAEAIIGLRSMTPENAAVTLVNYAKASTAIPTTEIDNLTIVVADIALANDGASIDEGRHRGRSEPRSLSVGGEQ